MQNRKGRWLVLAIIAIMIAIALIPIIMHRHEVRNDQYLQRHLWFLFTTVLCFFLYRGANWARWLSIVLDGYAGLLGLYLTISTTNILGMSVLTLSSYLIVFSNIAAAAILLFVPSVKRYFHVQEQG